MIDKRYTIGWIGTGLMGAPMARHILNAGYQLNVHTRTKSRANTLVDSGAHWFDTPADIAGNSDILFTIIGSPAEVEECYFNETGIFKTLRQGAIIVDMTTTKPSLAIKISNKAVSRNASFVDAPVSGGEQGAINGTLSIMTGGNPQIVESITPLLQLLGTNIVHQGPAGSGQHCKMCNQITLASTLVGVCEALFYGVKAGLDLNTMIQSISKGAAGCWSLDVLAPKIINQDYEPGFTIDNFIKDLSIALEESQSMNIYLPGLTLANQLYKEVKQMGKGNLGNQALYLAIDHLASKINLQ